MSSVRIGILGAGGDIGRKLPAALIRMLPRHRLNFVLATRRPGPVPERTADSADHDQRVTVDLADHDQLARFASSVDLVINAAGPSHHTAVDTAGVVLAAGADHVDLGGPADPPTGLPRPVTGRTALFHAGALPGAAGVLPRWLLHQHPGAESLTVITGGRGAFTRAGAEDYLAGISYGDVEPLAAWRGGHRVARAAERRLDVALEEFPDPVGLFPYLDADAEQIAREHHLIDATFYSAMVGDGITDLLMQASGLDLRAGSELLRAGSVALLAGRSPYVVLLVTADSDRAMLQAPGEAALAAEFAAAASAELLSGHLPDGVFLAADAVGPDRVVTALTGPDTSCTLTTASIASGGLMESGVL